MSLITKSVKGTQDLLPLESHKMQYIEQCAREVAEDYGYREIRTPVFEHTELFSRGVGDTTDVVQKEMYTFNDKGERSITLRPEGTAGAARSFIEHGLFNLPLPQKVYYLTSCYRYEKPQAGRLREFHQFGVECFGAQSAAADAQVICLAQDVLNRLGISDASLQINSIGCPECRKDYHKALYEYFCAHKDSLCQTCLDRLERNPMRILDCKSPVCSKIAKDAPVVLDYLCGSCKEHFDAVRELLKCMQVDFQVNPKIVRGLDYYTRTVFEFISNDIGAQGTLCGGGRYDGLIEQLGGSKTPALGFAMGLERIRLVMENKGCEFPEPEKCFLYIASSGENAVKAACCLACSLRSMGIYVETDEVGRSLKAQMKYANKIEAGYVIVLGDNELESGTAVIKSMTDKTESEIRLENAAEEIHKVYLDCALQQMYDIRLHEDALDDIGSGRH